MKGFTLIELMVVIAIIFILVATVLPAIFEFQTACDTLECVADRQDNLP